MRERKRIPARVISTGTIRKPEGPPQGDDAHIGSSEKVLAARAAAERAAEKLAESARLEAQRAGSRQRDARRLAGQCEVSARATPGRGPVRSRALSRETRMALTAAEGVAARCRARVLSLQPTELDVSSSTHLDAAVGLYHSVLPSISRRYLRKYMRRRGVTTLMLMMPLPSRKEADEEKELEKEGEEEDDDEEEDGDDDESEGESAEDEAAAATEPKAAAVDPAVAAAHRAAVATLRRRLVGVVSYEVGQRLGQRLLQVGLLGVRIRFQQSGVGSRLLKPLLQQRCEEALTLAPALALTTAKALTRTRCEEGALDAAVVFADHRAVPFFKKHGFSDDPMLNARYAEVRPPWTRPNPSPSQPLPEPYP